MVRISKPSYSEWLEYSYSYCRLPQLCPAVNGDYVKYLEIP